LPVARTELNDFLGCSRLLSHELIAGKTNDLDTSNTKANNTNPLSVNTRFEMHDNATTNQTRG
jgi:hypothetical protein